MRLADAGLPRRADDGPRELTHPDGAGRRTRGLPADGFVRVRREGPELEHVAEHRDASRADRGKDRERRLDRGRARVVRIVDNHVLGRAPNAHTVRGRVHRGERGRRLVERYAELGRGAQRGERGGNEVAAGDRQAYLRALAVRVRDEAYALDPGGAYLGGPQGRVARLTEENDTRPRARREGAHPRVVSVQQRDAVIRQRLDELGLAGRDGLAARRA